MFLLPSLGRPHRLATFIESYRDCEETQPVYLVLDANDPRLSEYQKLELPSSWKTKITTTKYCNKIGNEFFMEHRNLRFYGALNDDVTLETYKGLTELVKHSEPFTICWPNDCGQESAYPCFFVVGGDLVRTIGYLAPPGLLHNGAEGMYLEIGKRLKLLRYHPEIILKHHHPAWNRGEQDETWKHTVEASKITPKVFDEWMKNEFPQVFERVKEALYYG